VGELDNIMPVPSQHGSWDGIQTVQARTYKYKVYRITPIPAPRMTRADKALYRPCVKRYMAYRNALKGMNIDLNVEPLSLQFALPMPKSWSKKKKNLMRLTPHKNKPDLDNLIKAFKDALLEEDSHVWCYDMMTKVWDDEGSIIVLNHQNLH